MPENPFKTDSKLRSLLADVRSIKSGDAFANWKASFLKVYESYLDPDGVSNARDADGRLITKLQSLAKVSLKVQSLAQEGHICETQVTTDGRRALGKWTEEMKIVETAVAQFCPKTAKDEDTVGYDKFEIGAILIKDGFQAYEIMLTNRDFINELREGPLDGLLDKNTISIMDFYSREMQSFVDIMSDLGLMKLMTQCVEIFQEEPRPDPKTEPELFSEPRDTEEVEVESKQGKETDGTNKTSGGMGSKAKGKAGKTRQSSKAEKELGPGEDEEYAYKDAEDEIELPPPPPSEGQDGESEKIVYFDPKTGSIGVLLRDQCTESSELMFGKDHNGEFQNNGVIDSKAEKEELVWLLKKLEKKEKPKEGAWLEEIKKEKAARRAADEKKGISKKSSVRVKKEPVAGAKKPPSRKSSANTGSKPSGGSGFKNPFEQGPPPPKRKNSTGRRKSTVEDYQGKYKEAAPKPANSGWEKVEAEEEKQ